MRLTGRRDQQVQVAKYTDAEYATHLADENWSKAETDHLLELCNTYDLRFFVISDRWAPGTVSASGTAVALKPRTIDELKDRYYK